jgi:hypothetical protein
VNLHVKEKGNYDKEKEIKKGEPQKALPKFM